LHSTFVMPSVSLVNSPDQSPTVLIAALSGRALAELARKAGYRPLVADLFGDADMRRYAHASRIVRGELTQGPDAGDLMAALSDLVQQCSSPPIGVVCGAGFEGQPGVLDELAKRWRVLGCASDMVKRAKDPVAFARRCAELDLPHPEICFEPPADRQRWLAKLIGGSGGRHISPANVRQPAEDIYFQRRVTGQPISALVAGAGGAARVIGWSAQWISPAADAPYRWAGAVQPARIDPDLQAHLADSARNLAVKAAIVGIASIDFLVEGTTWHVLEINPRPGGTLDIFDDGRGRLFEIHIQACGGHLIEPPHYRCAQACAIAFAERDIERMPQIRWPDWCADLQPAGTRVEAGAPVCTIRAAADDPDTARGFVEHRRRALLQMVHEPELAPC
jgi:predicted ATP-grasp superfamily ATP-dependent carboligase